MSKGIRTGLLRKSIAVSVAMVISTYSNLAIAENNTQKVAISSKPLAEALVEVGSQYNVIVVAPDELISSLKAPSIEGDITASEAIDRLLKGTGLAVKQTESGAFVVTSNEANSSQQSEHKVNLKQITVTGELQERSLQETVTSVALIEPNANERELDDVLQRTANVGQDGFDDRFTIRGIGYDGVGFAGEAQTISVDIDGVPVDNWAIRTGWGSLWDMEQVEILRGPQSTAQGRNALAGAVVLRSTRPSFTTEGKARAIIAQDGTTGIAVAQGGALVDDILAYRFSAEAEGSDGYISNPTFNDDEYGEYERKVLRGSLLWRPNGDEDLEVLTSLRYSDSEVGEADVNNDADPFDYENTSGYADATTNANETLSLAVEVDWLINDSWSLLSTTTYNNTDYFTRTGFDTNPLNPSERSRDAEVDSYTQDLRFTFESDKLKGVLGIYASYFDEAEQFGGTLPAAFFGIPVAPYNLPGTTYTIDAIAPNEETNIALYTEWDYEFASNWTVIGGLRIDHERRERISETDSFVTPDSSHVGPADPFGLGGEGDPESAKTTFTALLPKIGLRYEVNDDITLGAMVSRGYRSGGTSIDLTPPNAINEYDPEYTWTTEFSLRSELLDNRLRFDANVFYTDWKDQQVDELIPPANVLTRTVNAGESHLYGAEFELSGYLDEARNLDAFVSIGLLKTKFDKFIDSNGTDYSGNKFPLAAEVNIGAGLKYSHPSGYFAGFDATYVGDRESDISNDPSTKVDAFTIVNVRAGYEKDGWGVTAFANNVFDEEGELFKNPATLTPTEPQQLGLIVERTW